MAWQTKLTDIQQQKLEHIKLAVFDVDGVLTSGQLSFLPNGDEVKHFNTLDGLGIKLLAQAGIKTAIITGRHSQQVALRAQALQISYLKQGREDKLVALQELWQETSYSSDNTAYIGDDLPDLAAIRAAAFGATVPNAHPLVQQHADWCTQLVGGKGAGREFCEAILTAQGKLTTTLEYYL